MLTDARQVGEEQVFRKCDRKGRLEKDLSFSVHLDHVKVSLTRF